MTPRHALARVASRLSQGRDPIYSPAKHCCHYCHDSFCIESERWIGGREFSRDRVKGKPPVTTRATRDAVTAPRLVVRAACVHMRRAWPSRAAHVARLPARALLPLDNASCLERRSGAAEGLTRVVPAHTSVCSAPPRGPLRVARAPVGLGHVASSGVAARARSSSSARVRHSSYACHTPCASTRTAVANSVESLSVRESRKNTSAHVRSKKSAEKIVKTSTHKKATSRASTHSSQSSERAVDERVHVVDAVEREQLDKAEHGRAVAVEHVDAGARAPVGRCSRTRAFDSLARAREGTPSSEHAEHVDEVEHAHVGRCSGSAARVDSVARISLHHSLRLGFTSARELAQLCNVEVARVEAWASGDALPEPHERELLAQCPRTGIAVECWDRVPAQLPAAPARKRRKRARKRSRAASEEAGHG